MIELKKIQVEKHLLKLAEEAIYQLNKISEDEYFLRRFIFRRVLGYRTPTLLLITVMDYGRPPGQALIAILPKDPPTFLFPGTGPRDFFKTADHLGLNSIEEYAIFYDLVCGTYGVTIKKCPPKRLRTSQDGRKYGISEEFLSDIIDTEEVSTWWQRWGGELYQLRINRNIPLIERQTIRLEVGFWKWMPFWVRR